MASLLFASLLTLMGCQKPGAAASVSRGRSVYQTQCIACHHPDPSLDGPLGPAVKGASLALLEARILEAKYPPGYAPKRATQQMVALPHLKPDIPALHAFLNP